MAWISLAALAGSPSPLNLGSDLSPTVRVSPTHRASYCPGCKVGIYPSPPFGTTLGLCAETYCHVTSISFSAVSLARISALRALALAWRVSEVSFTGSCTAWSAKSHPDSSFWRTCRPSGLVDFKRWSTHLPSSGSIVGGRLYPPRKSAPRIADNGGGSLLPTPSASSYGTNKGGAAGRVGSARPSLETMARKNLWPTPRAADAGKNQRTVEGVAKEVARKGSPQGLLSAVRLWPTPTASPNANRTTKPRPSETDGRGHGRTLSGEVGGQLNPTFVEWLMGYPIGWSVCADWATRSSLSKLEKPSVTSLGLANEA